MTGRVQVVGSSGAQPVAVHSCARHASAVSRSTAPGSRTKPSATNRSTSSGLTALTLADTAPAGDRFSGRGRRAADAERPRRELPPGPCRAVWSAGLGPPAAQHLEALGQDLLEVLDRTALQQHVPVGARRLDLLGGGLGTADQLARGAVELALPGVGHLGVVG